VALVGPPPLLNSNPFSMCCGDLRDERSATVPFPPGETRFSLARTRRFAEDPLPMLLESYERFGPVFTLRLFHGNVVFMLGPAANHYITVSHASNFTWRDGHFRDLIGLMGDGLLTIDGEFHRRSRLIMLPAFHHEHIRLGRRDGRRRPTARSTQLTPGRPDRPLRLDPPARLRVAMRALFGLDPDGERARHRRRRPVRAGPVLLLLRLRPAHAARPLHAVGAHAAGRAQARHADLLGDLPPPRTGERGEDILSLLLDATTRTAPRSATCRSATR
jgi:cytochrome P450